MIPIPVICGELDQLFATAEGNGNDIARLMKKVMLARSGRATGLHARITTIARQLVSVRMGFAASV